MNQKKIKVKRWRKITAFLLSAALAVSYVPGAVYAAENEVVDGGNSSNGDASSGSDNQEHTTHQWNYQKEGEEGNQRIKAVCSVSDCTYADAAGISLSINIAESYNKPYRPTGEVIVIKDVSGNALSINYAELGYLLGK